MITADNHQSKHENSSEGHKLNSSCVSKANNIYKRKVQQETKYQCPMNCEGNKTYIQPGECPECNMQLVVVGMDEPKIRVE